MRAREKQREKQQGLGRPIISAQVDRVRTVAVGNAVASFRPELTAERFIADPFSTNPQARLYKTAPVNQNLVMAYVGEHVLGMPRSY